MSRSTHTFVTLEISPAAFEEIAAKLRAAGYDHVFHDEGTVLDMHGIGLAPERANAETPRDAAALPRRKGSQ